MENFQWTDDMVSGVINLCIDKYILEKTWSIKDTIEKFKQSKQNKDWEIVAYTSDYLGEKDVVFTKLRENYYLGDIKDKIKLVDRIFYNNYTTTTRSTRLS